MSAFARCCCCTCILVVIVTIVMVAMSIKSLGVNTYGLDYAAITKTINDQVYTSGFHFLGFMH